MLDKRECKYDPQQGHAYNFLAILIAQNVYPCCRNIYSFSDAYFG
jgi:hypothetical protein